MKRKLITVFEVIVYLILPPILFYYIIKSAIKGISTTYPMIIDYHFIKLSTLIIIWIILNIGTSYRTIVDSFKRVKSEHQRRKQIKKEEDSKNGKPTSKHQKKQ